MAKRFSILALLTLTVSPFGCGKSEVLECETPAGEAYLCPRGKTCAPAGTPAGCYDDSQLPEACKEAPALDENVPCFVGDIKGACEGRLCRASCGDGVRTGNEICDPGDGAEGYERDAAGNWMPLNGEGGCRYDCRSDLTCGNGTVDVHFEDGATEPSGEVCDDGKHCENLQPCETDEDCETGECATRSGDGCSDDCSSRETCGNGIVDGAGKNKETCDLGLDPSTWAEQGIEEVDENGNWIASSGDGGCASNCRSDLKCGNGTIDNLFADPDLREVCDDGNTEGGDGCSADCRSSEYCGNGFLDPGEACDPGFDESLWKGVEYENYQQGGDWIDPAGLANCSSNCATTVLGCGNGELEVGELCDDGNRKNHDGCNSQCSTEHVSWRPWSSPRAKAPAAMAVDSNGDIIMLAGTHPNYHTALMWRWANELSTWQRVEADHMPAPQVRPTMAYDEERKKVVSLGTDSTWEWDGADWTKHDAALPLQEKIQPALVYDVVREKVVTIAAAPEATEEDAGQFTLYGWSGTAWESIPTSSATDDLILDARANYGLAYVDDSDSDRHELLLLGGVTLSDNIRQSSLYALSGDTWEARKDFPRTPINPTLVYSPGEGRLYATGSNGVARRSVSFFSYGSGDDKTGSWKIDYDAERGLLDGVAAAYVSELGGVLVAGGSLQTGRACASIVDQCDSSCDETGTKLGCEALCNPVLFACNNAADCNEGELCVERSDTFVIRDTESPNLDIDVEITSLAVEMQPKHPTQGDLVRPQGRRWAVMVDQHGRTWRFDGVAWEIRAAANAQPSPLFRGAPGLVNGTMVALSGSSVWLWNDNEDSWSLATSVGPAPTASVLRGFALEPSQGVYLHYDGDALFSLDIDGTTATWAEQQTGLPSWNFGWLVSGALGSFLSVGNSGELEIVRYDEEQGTWATESVETLNETPLFQRHGAAYDLDRDLIVVSGRGPNNGSVDTRELKVDAQDDGQLIGNWLITTGRSPQEPVSRFSPPMVGLDDFGVVLIGGNKAGLGLQETWIYEARSALPDEQCANDIDDDLDGLTDCGDAGDCGALSPCTSGM